MDAQRRQVDQLKGRMERLGDRAFQGGDYKQAAAFFKAALRDQDAGHRAALSDLLRVVDDLMGRAFKDELTGVGNRAAFKEAFSIEYERHSRIPGTNFFVVIFDLNDLKMANDTKGHEAGDLLIKGLAEILERESRKADTVARIGGDEFAVLLSPSSGARNYVDRVVEECREKGISVAVGSADADEAIAILRHGHETPTAESVFSKAMGLADHRMYADKTEIKEARRKA